MSILSEFWRFLVARRKVWLLPVLLALALVAGLLVFAQSSALGPLIYAVF
ncbi:MAG: DUF5989 family protein [Alphaproteobacteria bacterium]